MGVTVMIVGVGRFGLHYARILSRLNQERLPEIPYISRLVVTKTSRESAQRMAGQLAEQAPRACPQIEGAAVRDRASLTAALEQYRPQLICIAASDPVHRHDIHPVYASVALDYGNVLCEKPLCAATGDGASLTAARRLLEHPHGGRFGFELPFSVVSAALADTPRIEKAMNRTGRFSFRWGAAGATPLGLVDNLLPHPWSLLPRFTTPLALHTSRTADGAHITGTLQHQRTGACVDLSIRLSTRRAERSMAVDALVLSFAPADGAVRVACRCPGEGCGPASGREALTVSNPLRQQIVAALNGKPMVDAQRTYESQCFLEMAKGYVP